MGGATFTYSQPRIMRIICSFQTMPYLYEDGRDIVYKEIEKGLGYKQMQR